MKRKMRLSAKTDGTKVDTKSLRALVRSCETRQCHETALYLADKLVTLDSNDEDVFLLARLFYDNKNYRRAHHALHRSPLLAVDIRFQHLSACCLLNNKELDEALLALGSDDDEVQRRLEEHTPAKSELSKADLDLRAAVCLTRGKIYQAMENRRSSAIWYRMALSFDARCCEAFNLLVNERMLNAEEEEELVDSLEFPRGCDWLRELYSLQIDQYKHTCDQLEERVVALQSCELSRNLDVQGNLAVHAYYSNDFQRVYEISKEITENDPFRDSVLPVYVCSLVELEMKSELFYCAHQLSDTFPDKAITWFAVGCYYYLIRRYEVARRYFSKSTTIDSQFAPAWVGFGHSFAAQDESDPAMAAYRTAQRIQDGSHIPLLCLGMEFLRTNNLQPAMSHFRHCVSECPTDPLVYNEMGVLHYMSEEYEQAIDCFHRVIDLILPKVSDAWEATYYNIAHAYRKLQKFAEAQRFYKMALAISPGNASNHCALGMNFHLQGRLDEAIDCYHKALEINARDVLTSDLLSRALCEMFDTSM